MVPRTRTFSYYYAGGLVLAALLVGGGTEQGLWTDHLIEVALIPALLIGFTGLPESRFGALAKVLTFLLVILVALQFLLVARQWPPGTNDPAAMTTFFSPAPGRSLEAATFLLTMVGFALFVSRFPDAWQENLLKFFFVGLIANGAIGVVQMSFAQDAVIDGMLPFRMTAAVFANENHLSALAVAFIPILAWRFLSVARRFWTFLAIITLMLIFLFAVGSRAGMALSVAMAILSAAWFATGGTHPFIKAGVTIASLAASFAFVFHFFGTQTLDADLRAIFYRTTWRAIGDFWTSGSGIGTFQLVYPHYEKNAEIMAHYVNQAHNDYMQVFLETGLFGGVIFAVFLLVLFTGLARTKLAQAAFLSISALLMHSLVDYPLRTAAVAILFAYLSTILASRSETPIPGDTKNETGASHVKTPVPAG